MTLLDMKTPCFILFLLGSVRSMAQDEFRLEWSIISGGGTTSSSGTGGEFTHEASVGQFAVANAANDPGSEFTLSGGYWTFILNEPLDLGLAMQINSNEVTLTWDDSTGTPVQLESSRDLQLWEPVIPQPQHPPFREAVIQRRYYRLMPVP
jgi:hypothetical protein